MSHVTACPLCSQPLSVPEDGDGRRIRCVSCQQLLRVHDQPDVDFSLAPLCRGCGAEYEKDDLVCVGCGEDLEDTRALAADGPARPVAPMTPTEQRDRDIRRARRWVFITAMLFVLGAVLLWFLGGVEIDEVSQRFASAADDEVVVTLDGAPLTKAQVLEEVRGARWLSVVMQLALAAVMLFCYRWAAKAPLPALILAIALYSAVIVLSAVADPTTLFQGLIIKIFTYLGLIAGLRSALAIQDEEQPEPGDDPDPA